MLKNTFVTSHYKQDAAAVVSATAHGGGDDLGAGPANSGATAGYHIDQNTLQSASAGCPTTALRWVFTTSATTLNSSLTNETQFAGLCMNCHNKADLNNTAAATTANWRTMKRVHNSVKGWASTGGTNAGNTKHAYTCAKCHSTHNSNLPRLLVTNCLDSAHRNRSVARVTPTAAIIGPFSGSTRAEGYGRFPGGGGGSTSQRATAPGPWFFGNSGVAGAALTTTCHDTGTAGGTFDSAGQSQLWNTKSTW
jgi:hypothetical protein